MIETVVELAPELIELLIFGLISFGLSVVSLIVEQFALSSAQAGELGLGVWAGVMGAVALYFSFRIAVDRVRPAWRKLRRNGHQTG